MANKVDTPFKDATCSEPAFTIKPTLGSDPRGTPTESGVSGTVTPKELPQNSLWHGDKV